MIGSRKVVDASSVVNSSIQLVRYNGRQHEVSPLLPVGLDLDHLSYILDLSHSPNYKLCRLKQAPVGLLLNVDFWLEPDT